MDYSKFEPDFLLVPYKIIDKVDPSAQRVYGVIYALQQLSLGRCIASNEVLASFAKTSERSVERAISELSEHNFIYVEYKDEEKRHREFIIATVTYGGQNTLTDKVGGLDRQGWRTRPTPVATYKDIRKEEDIKSLKKETSSSLNTPLAEQSEVRGVERSEGEEDFNTEDTEVTIEECDDEGNPLVPRWGKRKPNRSKLSYNARKEYKTIQPTARGIEYVYNAEFEDKYEQALCIIENKLNRKFINRKKQYAAMDRMRVAGIGSDQIIDRVSLLHNEEFWRTKGFDLDNVEKDFDKR